MGGLLPEVDRRWFDSEAFGLLYRPHGGSGLALTLTDIENMEISRIRWWRERLDAQREADAEAIKNAGK